MAKTFYTDFVRHCLRFYARYSKPKFRSAADKHNWSACDSALKGFNDSERVLLLNIYREGDTLADNIYQAAKITGTAQDKVWKLTNELERRVAKRRGLL